MKRARILTFHRVVNNGAVLQNAALLQHLQARFPSWDVKTLDYEPWNTTAAEILRAAKTHPQSPLFGIRRYRIFREAVNREIALDPALSKCARYETLVEQLRRQDYDLLITGSDCIWRVTDSFQFPPFPSIFWLSDTLPAKKLAYAVSANKYKPPLVRRHRDTIRRLANAFDCLTVRDADTEEMLRSCGVTRELHRMPDPAFLYTITPTRAAEKMKQVGIDLDRPVVGLLYYGAHPKVAEIVRLLRKQGYQVAALSMFSPYADVNLGDVLDPFEWAEAFKYLQICVTDRFHGTVFCLKNETPFLAIETSNLPKERCKKAQLLSAFGLDQLYFNLNDPQYDVSLFEARLKSTLEDWQGSHVAKVRDSLEQVENERAALAPHIEALMSDV